MSGLEGEHAGTRRAQFAELADHRGYQPGDDPRLIDWNAYARLDELYVRTSSARQGMTVSLLLDCSASMAAPGPGAAWGAGAVPGGAVPGGAVPGAGPGGRLLHAKRIAAALGAVGLLHGDTVRGYGLGDGQAWPSEAFTGRAALGPLLRSLEALPVRAGTHLADSVRSCGPGPARSGAVVLISDMLVPREQDAALERLGPFGTILHLTDPAEAALPPGSMELRDCETGDTVSVTMTPAVAGRYRDLAAARSREVAGRAAASGVAYIGVDITQPVDDLIFETLPGRGLVGSAPA